MEDATVMTEQFNDFETRKFLNMMFPVSVKQEEDFILDVHKRFQEKTGYHFVIENKEHDYLGSVGLGSISNIDRKASVGIAITNKKFWGQGYGTDAMRTICAIGFQIVNLHRIELDVHEFNKRAIRSYEKVGFTKIGQKRESNWIDGKYVDSIIMDILAREFEEKYGHVDLTGFSPY